MLLTSILRWAVACCCQAEIIDIPQIATRAVAIRPNKAVRRNCTDEEKLRTGLLQLMLGLPVMERHQLSREDGILPRGNRQQFKS
jgi:hypothetical protein